MPLRRPVVDRVRGEFIEMRGFSPTVQQAARLFDLPSDACRDVLSSLEREGFLTCTPDGRYRLQG
jgi:DNA-binding IclR family transcriptional regulator